MIAGDFNQWNAGDALQEFVDIREVQVWPTRGDRAIDRIFTNMSRSITDYGTLSPLETEAADGEEALRSDHKIVYMRSALKRTQTFEWLTYSYRDYDDEAVREFGRWVVLHDWIDVITAEGSDRKADVYQGQLDAAMDRFFPIRTTRRKSSDLPWINRAILKRIRRRNRIYRKEGRSAL